VGPRTGLNGMRNENSLMNMLVVTETILTIELTIEEIKKCMLHTFLDLFNSLRLLEIKKCVLHTFRFPGFTVRMLSLCATLCIPDFPSCPERNE
jgi:hypothetical protein